MLPLLILNKQTKKDLQSQHKGRMIEQNFNQGTQDVSPETCYEMFVAGNPLGNKMPKPCLLKPHNLGFVLR
jgi:hypothetical protein